MLLAIALLSSCSRSFGNKLTDPDLDVYYEFSEDENKASALGKYWKKNGFTGDAHQSIRLTKDKEHYFVQLIASNEKNAGDVSFEEMKLLLDLQDELDSVIFNSGMRCQIVICDGQFKPLFNINQ